MARRPGTQAILLHMESAGLAPVGQPPAANGGARPPTSEKAGTLKVSIIVGTSRSEDNEELLQRFKTEFERFLK